MNEIEAGKWVGVMIGITVTFVVVAALYSTLADALTAFDSAVGNSISAAILVIVPLAIGVGLLLYALRETGLFSSA